MARAKTLDVESLKEMVRERDKYITMVLFKLVTLFDAVENDDKQVLGSAFYEQLKREIETYRAGSKGPSK